MNQISSVGNLELLAGLPDDTTIYRITTFENVVELFQKKKLTLSSPALWVDPLEKFLLEGAFGINNSYGTEVMAVFAQCWSKKARSEALWSVYSPNRTGIRIETTVRKLRASIAPTNQVSLRIFVGAVSYLPQSVKSSSSSEQKDNRFEYEACKAFKRFQSSLDPKEVAKLLLIKRMPFDHEHEVRLIAIGENCAESYMQLDINPKDLISSIQFDPRMQQATKTAMKNYLCSDEVGYERGFVKSMLYSVPSSLEDYISKLTRPKRQKTKLV